MLRTSALLTFLLIYSCFQTVSAVPIVDDEGKLVGTISSTDLRKMVTQPAQFASMGKRISDFHHDHIRTHDLFTVKASNTLEEVIRKFQSTRVHRLFVVDAEKRPTAVVSLRDVLAKFVKEDAGSTLTRCLFDHISSSSLPQSSD